ncbi:MAG: hypothetical protein ACE5PM_02125 [Candidatus Hydrothermarchaeales archaeon]
MLDKETLEALKELSNEELAGMYKKMVEEEWRRMKSMTQAY